MSPEPNQRHCLPCTACCEGWLDVSEDLVQAHIGKPCAQCTTSGCGIYPNRPLNPCQTFLCAWRQVGTPLNESMRPDLSGVILIMDRLMWRDQYVIVGIPTGELIPEKSMRYLQGLATLMKLNLLTVRFIIENGQFNGSSKLTAYGDSDFHEDMKSRFKDGVLQW